MKEVLTAAVALVRPARTRDEAAVAAAQSWLLAACDERAPSTPVAARVVARAGTRRAQRIVAMLRRVRLVGAMASVVCLVTTPPDRARPIAAALVERELVACVNIVGGVQSVYRWKGAVEHDDEALLVIKTTRAAVPALEDALAELHPYETFELVALDIAAGAAPYLDWIGASVTLPQA